MAGLAAPGSLWEQVGLIAWLRWKVFQNSLRSLTARLNLIARLVGGLFDALLAIGLGIGMGLGAYVFVSTGRWALLALLFWVVFGVWQLLPLLVATFSGTLDLRNLLRFPLRFSAFFLLQLAYGLFDPVALAALFLLACITAGITLARPALLPWTLVVLGLFALMNLLLNRLVFSWLMRLLAHRRAREALFAILILFFLSVQFLGPFAQRSNPKLQPVIALLGPVLRWMPPALVRDSLAAATTHAVVNAILPCGLLAAYGLAFGWLFARRLRAEYRGEELSETQAVRNAQLPHPSSPAVAASVAPARTFATGWLPGPVAAVAEKEIRYLVRNTVMLLNLALPLILIAFFGFGSRTATRHGPQPQMFQRMPELAFPAAVAYMVLLLSQLAHNSFGQESSGVQVFFAAPVRFRDVLLGKNLTFCLVLFGESALMWLLISAVFRPPGAAMVVGTLAWLLFALLTHFLVGNWLSLRFPRRFEFGRHRQRPAGVSVLVGLALQVFLLGSGALVYVIARWLGHIGLFALVYLILAAASVPVYLRALDSMERLAAEQREALISELMRSRAR